MTGCSGSVFLDFQGKRRILHISVHLGGGVGSTVLGYISVDKENHHEIMCLGYTMEHIKDKVKSLNIPYKDKVSNEDIIEVIPKFDIIIIHVWNHPLLYNLLVRCELPPCRLIMWGHNSGFIAPNVYPKKIFTYPDLFVFTTPLSYDLEEIKDVPKEKLTDIWSTAGVDDFINIERKEHEGFIVGYIGTVDYAKLHPNFLKMCKAIDIPNVKFIVVGGLKEKEIEKEAKEMGITNIEFIGVVPYDKLKYYLSIFDVFGYPLAPYHYGTCDLTLQIAMASGVIPIVFNNPMESYMIKSNFINGIIVLNNKGYVDIIKTLYNNPKTRNVIGEKAKKYAIKKFSLEKLKSKWNKILNRVIKLSKTKKKWNTDKTINTFKDIFLESIGEYSKHFENIEEIIKLSKQQVWQSETKGSVHNYNKYFPHDKILEKWSRIMEENK